MADGDNRRNGRNGRKDREPTLVIIGGHEDKEDEPEILREVAERVGDGTLVIVTVASRVPDELWRDYERAFGDLGVHRLERLEVETRADAVSASACDVLRDARGIFFTGGQQLRITSILGDTPVFQRIREIYDEGGVIAGTSAGASVMTETMLVSGDSEQSSRLRDSLTMAPGLGFLPDAIVDQHFAERGRIGRLIGAVSQNPRLLGIGIDENTAIVVSGGQRFTVCGAGGVYVLDGRPVTYSNVTEGRPDDALAVCDLRLHVLSRQHGFDLSRRRPAGIGGQEAIEVAVAEEESWERR